MLSMYPPKLHGIAYLCLSLAIHASQWDLKCSKVLCVAALIADQNQFQIFQLLRESHVGCHFTSAKAVLLAYSEQPENATGNREARPTSASTALVESARRRSDAPTIRELPQAYPEQKPFDWRTLFLRIA
jgi:hypothetical protein